MVRPVRLVPILAMPAVAVLAGVWIYLDARRRGRPDLASILGVAVALVFLAGSVPAFVALAVSTRVTVQGFPTALRIVPGVAVLAGYLLLRDRIGQ